MDGRPRLYFNFDDLEIVRIQAILIRAVKMYGRSQEAVAMMAFEGLEKEMNVTDEALRAKGRKLDCA